MVGRGSLPMVHGTLLTNTCFVGVSPWDICWCVKSFRSGRVECGGSAFTADSIAETRAATLCEADKQCSQQQALPGFGFRG